jgi:hypothetical protein
MSFRNNKTELCFFTAFILIAAVAYVLLLSSLVFFVGGSLSSWNFPLSFVLAAVTAFVLTDKKNTVFAAVVFALFAVLVSLPVAGYFIDTSWDGQFYHQEAVYQLKEGWNPQRHFFPETINAFVWINHYPKAAEIPQASVYGMTGFIETGKATNLLFWLASFLLTTFVLRRTTSFPRWKVLLYGFFLSSSPIVINQAFTYYIDGQVSAVILCIASLCVLMYREYRLAYLLLSGFLLLILMNLKFTGLIYAALLMFAYLLLLLLKKKMDLFRKVIVSSLVAGVVAVLAVGYNPYITNMTNNGHPFYPVMGEPGVDVMAGLMPTGFEGKGRFERFFISLFSHTDDPGHWLGPDARSPQLKIPFMLNRYDFSYSRIENARIGGFGPFFSGILIFSILAAVLALKGRKERLTRYTFLYVPLVLTVLVFLFPEAWWARFIPYLWFVPFCFLLMAEVYGGTGRKFVLLKYFIYFAVVVNLGFALLSVPYRILKTEEVKYQMAQMKAWNQPVKVEFKEARSNEVRFREYGLPFVEGKIDESKVGYIIGSNTRFETQGELPVLPKPFILRMLNR